MKGFLKGGIIVFFLVIAIGACSSTPKKGEQDQGFKSKMAKAEFKSFYNLHSAGGDIYQGDYEAAIKKIKQAIEVFPHPESWLVLAEIYFELDQYEKAKETCAAGIQLNNERSEDFPEAQHIVDEMNAKLIYLIGDCLFMMKQYEEALTSYRKAHILTEQIDLINELRLRIISTKKKLSPKDKLIRR